VSDSGADAGHMAHALRIARLGLYTTDPNPRVGCVLVKAGRVVGSGWHRRAGEPHAEIHALRAAGEASRGANAFITLEPCSHHGRTPPCVEALITAGIARAVIAMHDPNPQVAGSGIAALARAGIATEVGLLQAQALALNAGFSSRMRRGRPLVRVKLAASLDGRTAMASGESMWITGAAARADVQRWRARSSAILCGIGTVETDDPALTVRDFDIGRRPLRVVVDGSLRVSPNAKVLTKEAPTLVVTAVTDEQRVERLRRLGTEVICLPAPDGRVDLAALMQYLGGQEINEVLVESGPRLCGALLTAGLVDELILYLAPCLLGSKARPLLDLPDLVRLQDRVMLEVQDSRALGGDWRIVCTVKDTRSEVS
jgi:diaminohydroxyphosphoribosylaminopyrimidine deaminase/5-amino-6-(5-phosphoribosylamino)uracil reductase